MNIYIALPSMGFLGFTLLNKGEEKTLLLVKKQNGLCFYVESDLRDEFEQVFNNKNRLQSYILGDTFTQKNEKEIIYALTGAI